MPRYREYSTNAERQAAYRQRRTPIVRTLIDNHKARPCADCGQCYPPWVMDFDHITGEKEFKLADAVGRGGELARIKAELGKCEVVCANCHRQRSYDRGQTPYGSLKTQQQS